MFKVAIVGPAVSVERIQGVAEEFSGRLLFSSFMYEAAVETKTIVQENYHQYDFFLFSGPIPYELALRTNLDASKFFMITLLENGFYRALLNLTLAVRKPIERLSIDIIDTSDVVDASLGQLTEAVKDVYVERFDAAIDHTLLYEHHIRLWEAGKIEAVLTCYPEVMHKLKQRGIPAEWISTTKLAAKQVLEAIVNHAEIHYLKRTQIGVCMIQIDQPWQGDLVELSYDIQLTTLRINEELLLLSREMNGSFISLREGQYMIFSSRGEIIDTFSVLQETINRLERAWNRKITGGIGFGDSALKAEMNARKAFQLTQNEPDEVIIVGDDGRVLELPKEFFHESSAVHEAELYQRLQEGHISIQLFDRIREVIRRKKWTTFTAKELALELKMSDRNAQRALAALTKAQIVKQAGEEKVVAKGRPSKLYQLMDSYQ